MKRLALYALILALVWIIPVERADVAKLRPIEVIAVYQTKDTVILATDTDDLGIGSSVMNALLDMHQTSPAVIYLDTAEYLLIGKGAEQAAEELRNELKASVKVCAMEGEIHLSDAAEYLDVHGKLPLLRQWKSNEPIPLLTQKEGRMSME